MSDNNETVENMEWRDGRYTGELSDGVPHGQGELDWKQPVEYRPGWKGSEVDDADEYLGQVRLSDEYDIDRHSYTWDECAKYVGEFNQGQPDGEGTLTMIDGSTYVGQFKDGKWHGEGAWTHPDGDEISGQWKEGRLHGQARWKEGRKASSNEEEGDEYIGEWKDGLKHGKGTFTNDWGGDHHGYKYVGDWYKDHEIGFGVITYPTSVYEGDVSFGVPSGHGLMTYEDGSSFRAEWKVDDDFVSTEKWEGTEYDIDGNITATYVEGERIEKIVPFNDAQASAEEHEDFNAPDLDHIATLKKGDMIEVGWIARDDEGTGERFWLKVIENRESEIKGTVENHVTEAPYEVGEEVVIPHNCVYDYIRYDAVATYPEVFDDLLNPEVSSVIYAVSENSIEGALRSERSMTVLRLAEKLTATYPTDINAHVESSGGWTDLGALESGDALLAPSTADISISNLEGGSVEVQHAETQEKFWIKVVRIDTTKGILYGLVKKEFAKAQLSRWQPVQCHVFQIWDAIFPRAKETLNLADGATYIGEVSDGFPDGEGIWTLEDGTEYVGEFKNGNREGFGTMTDPDGVRHTGEWENDQRNGQGTHSREYEGRSIAYSGEFKDDRPNGQIIEILPDGSIYVGRAVVPTGKEGHGTWTFLNGSKYVGEFRDNEVNGPGTWTYPDGQVYAGEWKDGTYHGHGTRTDPDGARYTGEWKNGLNHGQGEQLYKSGSKFVGEWKEKYPWKGTVIDEDGAQIATYLKGVRSDNSFDFKTRKKWSKFVSSAVSDVMESQGIMSKEYGLGGNDSDYKRWYVDQKTGCLTFFRDDLPGIIAKIQYIGSTSTAKNDWLWSWANTTILDQVKDQMHVVKEFGDKNGFTPLTTTSLIEYEDDIETLGWQLMSVAHKLLDAKGAYRIPYEGSGGFVIFTDIQKTGHFQWPTDAKKGGDNAKNGAGTETYPDGSKYVGEFKDGLFHGQGTTSYANATLSSGIKGSKYVGEFKDGLFHGHGTLVLTDGTQYTGDWKEGKRHGHGTVTNELFKCTGDFQDDQLQGEGTYTFLDGSTADIVTMGLGDEPFIGLYTGEVSDGVPNGRGISSGTLQGRYVGEWKDGLKHGWGTEDTTVQMYESEMHLRESGFYERHGMLPPGPERLSGESKYVGEWREGKKHGQGTQTYLGGNKYVGQFKDDEYHGEGVKTYLDGAKEVGKFVEGELYNGIFYDQSGVATTVLAGMRGTYAGDMSNGVPNGQGTLNFPNGPQYVGEFKDGDLNGQGTEIFDDEIVYVGEFKDDKYHGQGTYTSPDGGKYVGEWKDGREHGQGTYTGADGEKYIGEFKEGIPHGQGTHTSPDGSKYVGEFKDDEYHGQGTLTFPHGSQYVGEWEDGLKHGQGTLTFPDGAQYVGEFKDDEYHGQGTYTSANGPQYVGEFKDGDLNGQGTEIFDDEIVYVGEFKDDKYHGQGTYTSPDGGKYVGEWKDGREHGQGTYTGADGEKYIGEFKEGIPHGQGTHTSPDGSKYVGEFKDDEYHGQGTLTAPDGSEYIGQWKNDKKHGQATFRWGDGSTFIGEFSDNRMWDGTQYDVDGHVTGVYSGGVWKEK